MLYSFGTRSEHCFDNISISYLKNNNYIYYNTFFGEFANSSLISQGLFFEWSSDINVESFFSFSKVNPILNTNEYFNDNIFYNLI